MKGEDFLMMEKYMNSTEIMAHLGSISKSTLLRYEKQGMPVEKTSPRKKLYSPSAVDQWVKERSIINKS